MESRSLCISLIFILASTAQFGNAFNRFFNCFLLSNSSMTAGFSMYSLIGLGSFISLVIVLVVCFCGGPRFLFVFLLWAGLGLACGVALVVFVALFAAACLLAFFLFVFFVGDLDF